MIHNFIVTLWSRQEIILSVPQFASRLSSSRWQLPYRSPLCVLRHWSHDTSHKEAILQQCCQWVKNFANCKISPKRLMLELRIVAMNVHARDFQLRFACLRSVSLSRVRQRIVGIFQYLSWTTQGDKIQYLVVQY